jgi:hypothetical protein
VKRIPGAERVAEGLDDGLKVALNGAAKAVFMPAIASVSIKRRTKQLRKRHPEIGDGSPFSHLDLQALDKGRPKLVIPFAGALESVGASVTITGAEVSTTVSGGATAGVVLLAITADISASLVLLGRAVAQVAVHYGFDPKEPEEEVFLMGVLSYSTAASLEGKVTALTALARLSQQMMRRATWKELNKDVVVHVIQSVFTRIGVNLSHKRLAQAVPVVGGVLSAGLSFDMLDRSLRDATRVYRARYLAEKHNVSFDEWVERVMTNDVDEARSDTATDERPVDVVAVMQRAIVEHAELDASAPSGDESGETLVEPR